jgi:uncharacterized protein
MTWKNGLQKFASLLLKGAVLVYRYFFSFFFVGSCRFEVSCSRYALEVIDQETPHRAIFLIIKRLLRCQPFYVGVDSQIS